MSKYLAFIAGVLAVAGLTYAAGGSGARTRYVPPGNINGTGITPSSVTSPFFDGGTFSSAAANNVCGFENRTEGARVCYGPDSYCAESGTNISCNTFVQASGFYATSDNGIRFSNVNASTGVFYGWGSTITDPGAACNTTISPTGLDSTIGYDGDGWFHVACDHGAANRLSGVISSNTTGVGNVGVSAPDDLQSYTLPASILVHTGRCVRVTATGTTANNANAKTVRLVFGAGPTAMITKQLTASIAGSWQLSGTICRTGSSTQRYAGTGENSGGTTVSTTDGTGVWRVPTVTSTATETETNTMVIKTQSTVSTSDNDIVSQHLLVEIL